MHIHFDGETFGQPTTLPRNWTAPDGRSVSNLPALPPAFLAGLGWYEVDDTPPALADGEVIEAVGYSIVEGPGAVPYAQAAYTVRAKTADELAAELAAAKAAKRATLAATRYAHEIGGTTVAGASLLTDRESQGLLTGAALAATLDPNYTVTWKAANGWVTLDAPTLVAMAQAVRAHVQACFDREKVLDDAISAAATVAEVEVLDITTGWP